MVDEVQTGEAEGTVRCAACGAENPAGMRFCGSCGKPLAPAAAPPAVSAPVNPPPAETAVVPVPKRAVAVPAVAIPADPIARERERDRLLTLANVQRMRGQTSDARKTLENALSMVEGRAAAPIHELMGDLLANEEKWAEAQEAYNEAHIADPARAAAERKYATMTLRVADAQGQRSLADAVLRGDSITDLMASTTAQNGGRGRRNAGMAMFLSIIMPGFGQFYNGDILKGIILVGIFLADLLLLALTPDKDIFTRKIAAIFALSAGKYANQPVSALAIFAGIVLVGVWLFSIVDAPFMAAKTANAETEGGKPVIDKTGWEV